MKKLLSGFLSLCMIFSCMVGMSVTASALDPQTGALSESVTYTLSDTNNDGTYDKLEITGTGAMPDYNNFNNRPWNEQKGNIKTVSIGADVTHIGMLALYGATGLTTVTIADGSALKSIGMGAFQQCTSLSGITLPTGLESIEVTAFYNCEALTSVAVPAGVTSIGAFAFTGCSDLASVTIPASVTSIGSDVFTNCSSLIAITYEGTAEEWAQLAVNANVPNTCFVIPKYTLVPAVAPTCTTDGNIAYYVDAYNNIYTKSGSTYTLVTAADVVDPASHTLTHVEEKPGTCKAKGVAEHWKCTVCGALFSDASGENETTEDELATEIGLHTITYIAGVWPTCTASGVMSHYKCTVCGKLFTDNDGTKETTLAAITTAALAHSYENGKCTRCGEADPDYIEPAEPEPDPTPTPYISPYIPMPSPSITPASTTPSTAAASDTAAGVMTAGNANNANNTVTNTNVKEANISLKNTNVKMKLGQIAKINIKKLVVIDNLAGSKDVKIKVSVPKSLKYTLKNGVLTVAGARKGTFYIKFKVSIFNDSGALTKSLRLKVRVV